MLPTRRADIAGRLLAVVETLPRESSFSLVDLAADLAEQAGDRRRAGQLLATSGRASLDRGALATAADTLRRAGELLAPGADRCTALLSMTQALALAGRVDEAVASGERLLPHLPTDRSRGELHVTLATAMVAAARWAAASAQLDSARQILQTGESPGAGPGQLHDQICVLRAEIDLATDHFDRARQHAEAVLSSATAVPDLRCHALELIGRSHRTRDLAAARLSFEQALSLARASDLALATLRSLHELGTIEMFDHAGTGRLRQARRLADRLGALGTGGVLDLHLAATYMFVFDVDAASRHADAAVAISTRLGLEELRALALMFTAQIAALRCQEESMERYLALAAAIAGNDLNIDGSGWCGARGMLALLTGRSADAMDAFARGISLLRTLPHSGPANYRGLWPLLLAAANDARTSSELGDARRNGMAVNRCNRGLFAYAEAIMCGRRGEVARAEELARGGDADLVRYPVWADIARLHAAPAALEGGWGQPHRWLIAARESFDAKGLAAMSARCSALLDGAADHPPGGWGITARETEVLQLVAEGLSNKDIATSLFVSPRTVEKHIESLLRKAGARSRTQLVARATAPGH